MKVTGVIHMHSTHSYDGKLSLSELKAFLIDKGVQFACMTEHTDYLDRAAADKFVTECRDLSDDRFIFVPGFEVPYGRAHVLHIGATEFVCTFANAAQLKLWRKVSPLVVLAHPVRNQYKVDETLKGVIDGIEVWNQQYDGKQRPRVKSVKLLKKLRTDKPLMATGGIDFHRSEHFGNPFITVELESLTEAGIVRTFTAGEFSFGCNGYMVAARADMKLSF